MNLKSFVASLSDKEKQELLALLETSDASIENNQPEPTEEDFLKKNNPNFSQPANVTETFQVRKQNKLNKSRREAVKANKNAWSDTGEDRHIETPKTAITPRNRPKPKMKKVKCHICGKQNNVRSSLVYGEFYRCDNCVG